MHHDEEPKTPEQVNKIIPAEMTYLLQNEELFEFLFTKHVLCTPCDSKEVHLCRRKLSLKYQKTSELPEHRKVKMHIKS